MQKSDLIELFCCRVCEAAFLVVIASDTLLSSEANILSLKDGVYDALGEPRSAMMLLN